MEALTKLQTGMVGQVLRILGVTPEQVQETVAAGMTAAKAVVEFKQLIMDLKAENIELREQLNRIELQVTFHKSDDNVTRLKRG